MIDLPFMSSCLFFKSVMLTIKIKFPVDTVSSSASLNLIFCSLEIGRLKYNVGSLSILSIINSEESFS